MKTLCTGILALTVLCIPAWGESSPAHGADRNTAVSNRLVIVDFTGGMNPAGWEVEDDVVMGGRSKGAFSISKEGHAVFSGTVSLENDGGFSSVQHYFDPVDISAYRSALLRIKGDGKRYRFLVESKPEERHYYVYEFETTGEWQTVRVPLSDMYPVFHGDRLSIPNYPAQTLSMVRFMIANKKAETFRLEVDSVWLE